MMYEFRYVVGHVEVFLNGKFQFSADTIGEAVRELEEDPAPSLGWTAEG